MTDVNHPTFRQSLEKNLNWIRDYWTQLSALFVALGILLKTYTIWTYTNAIGRPDLMPGALEAPSDLVTWLVFLAFVAAAYLLIIMTTSMLFGLSISLFKRQSNDSTLPGKAVALAGSARNYGVDGRDF